VAAAAATAAGVSKAPRQRHQLLVCWPIKTQLLPLLWWRMRQWQQQEVASSVLVCTAQV
jgi:hypothetical protein